jgi:hypothetical protein
MEAIMGGIGSGQYSRYGASHTTDDYRLIDVRRWQRDGLLTPNKTFSWRWSRHGEEVASIRVSTEVNRVTLTYRHRNGGGDWKDKSYPVWLDWTPCNYGGQRAWFRCPASGCGRRVAILYSGSIFACRHCHQLAYQSQREQAHDRTTRRADKIRERLCWESGILNGNGQKPKGMHWRTFEQLTIKHDALLIETTAVMAKWLKLL